ncbi:MAG: hypothetical protein IT477_01520 [Rhodanobacteraceae bacterium]|nr:hypothetical protein [Rhodanobacteraceae bacterium]
MIDTPGPNPIARRRAQSAWLHRLGLFVLLPCAALPATATARDAAPGLLAPEVMRFIQRRDSCDHFRGEEAYDAARREFLLLRVREHCTGSDAELAALKARYKDQPAVMERLDRYESRIEDE